MNNRKILVLGFLFAFAFSVLSAHLKSTQDKSRAAELAVIKEQLRAELRDQMQRDLERQIQARVDQEVQRQIADALVLNTPAPALTAPPTVQDLPLAAAAVPSAIAPDDETISQAVQRTLRSLSREYGPALTDAQLDNFVAGDLTEPEIRLPGGLSKAVDQPRMILASATDATKGAATPAAAATPASEAAMDESGGKERVESIERTLVQKGSILLPKGTLQFEPSFAYAHFSSNRINIDGFTILDFVTIGEISVDTVKRDVFIQTLSFKYGLLHNLQTELRVPSRWEFDRISGGGTVSGETTRSAGGLGDISLAISRQIGWEHGMMPDLVASLTVKGNNGEPSYNNDIGIGTGHWGVSSSLVAAKASDPAVIFGSLSYSYSLPESFENYGKVIPGQTFGYSLGTAIALSYQTAINFSFDQSVTTKMTQGGQTVVGSFLNSANFKSGFNWSLNERSSVDFALSFGLTSDAPDFTVELRFPYVF